MGANGTVVGPTSSVYLGVTILDDYVRLENRKITTTSTNGFIALYKNTSYTGGTALLCLNQNQRNYANADICPFTAVTGVTPGVLDPNNLIARIPIRSTTQTPVSDKIDNVLDVLFLEKNTDYILELQNDAGGNADFDISVTLVSETPQVRV